MEYIKSPEAIDLLWHRIMEIGESREEAIRKVKEKRDRDLEGEDLKGS